MSQRPGEKDPGKKNDWFDWALIVFFFAVGWWFLALILLFWKLFGNDSKGKNPQEPPLMQATPAQKSRRPEERTRVKSKTVMRSPAVKKSSAKALKIIGLIIAAVGLLAIAEPVGAIFWSTNWLSLWLEDFLAAAAMVVAGGAMVGSGLSMSAGMKRYAKYMAVMGEREAMSVAELARTLGYSERRVEKDLQKMIDKGYFGDRAYLNVELGYLFRSGQADAAWKQRQEEAQKAATPKEAEEGYSGILRNIRRANDRIADPVLTAKIDRLEAITARIFREVEAHPEKKGKISTFLNYYLPTTQKLLDSYANFDAAGVEGENLRQAKQRIEDTMDSIVRGFEHQLDALYAADAMEVDSDIRVMETMLRRDGASAERDFGLGSAGETVDLGGVAAQKQEKKS